MIFFFEITVTTIENYIFYYYFDFFKGTFLYFPSNQSLRPVVYLPLNLSPEGPPGRTVSAYFYCHFEICFCFLVFFFFKEVTKSKTHIIIHEISNKSPRWSECHCS